MMPQGLKLIEHVRITGRIICLTGLRIGGTKDDIEIGGMDNPIIRHPVTREPYIPGSSLKGKLRSMLEYRYW
jgi:CRISPR-associated protein Csm3